METETTVPAGRSPPVHGLGLHIDPPSEIERVSHTSPSADALLPDSTPDEPIKDAKPQFQATVEDCDEESLVDGADDQKIERDTPVTSPEPDLTNAPEQASTPPPTATMHDAGDLVVEQPEPVLDMEATPRLPQKPQDNTGFSPITADNEALKYLNEDSPSVTPEAIKKAFEGWHKRKNTPSSPYSQSFASANRGNNGTHEHMHWSTTATAGSVKAPNHEHLYRSPPTHGVSPSHPEFFIQPAFQNVPPPQQMPPLPPLQTFTSPASQRAYPNKFWASPTATSFVGAPPPNVIPPPSATSQQEHMPLSGYELLAAKLAGILPGEPVKPIYRRFEALNHRILLHLQDDIADLEDQLRGLDAIDTQTRWHGQGLIMPACQRQGGPTPDELIGKRKHILGEISYRLDFYRKIMSSLRECQDIPIPTMGEIQDYRTYLAASRPIAERESQFLNHTDDLVSLAPEYEASPTAPPTDGLLTPMPQNGRDGPTPGFLPQTHPPQLMGFGSRSSRPRPQSPPFPPGTLAQIMLGALGAIVVPTLTFVVISGFAGRMTVVALVGLGALMAAMQSGLLAVLAERLGAVDWVLWMAVYGGVMAVIAGSFA